MKRSNLALVVPLVVAAAFAGAAGCRSSGDGATGAQPIATPRQDSGEDGDAGQSGGDASDDAPDSAPPARQAYVRVAQLSPGMEPIDLCVALHGTGNFVGPLVARLSGDDADGGAASPGIAYSQVSAYLALDVAQYDVRIVPAGATSCDASLSLSRPLAGSDGGSEDAGSNDDASSGDAGAFDAAASDAATDGAVGDATANPANVVDAAASGSDVPDFTSLPSLATNMSATLVVTGDLSTSGSDAALTVALIADDAILPGGNAELRAVNALSSAPSLDFGLGSFGMGWLPLFVAVPFATAGVTAAPGAGVPDANGYLALDPASVNVLSARATAGATTDSVVASVEGRFTEGSIVTAFAIGGKSGDSAHPPSILICTDNQPSGGSLSDCSVVGDAQDEGGAH